MNDQSWNFKSLKDTYENLPVPQIPLANAATALAAISYSKLDVSINSIHQGLAITQLTGRFQIISENPLIIIDVAHNPHAAKYLNTQLQKVIQNRNNIKKVRIVIGMLKDKDIKSTIAALKADCWYCASLYGERGATAEDIAVNINPSVTTILTFPSVKAAWEQAKTDADENDIIVVCGSFYTVSDILGIAKNDEQ